MTNLIKTIVIHSQSKTQNESYSESIKNAVVGWHSTLVLASKLSETSIKLVHLCDAIAEDINSNYQHITYLSQEQLALLDKVGITEKQLFIECNASNSLGYIYKDWSNKNQNFALVEGEYGVNFNEIEFQHYVTATKESLNSDNFDEFSLGAVMSKNNKFVHPIADKRSILSTYSYGINLDTKKYIQLIQKAVKNLGVVELSGEIISVKQSNLDCKISELEQIHCKQSRDNNEKAVIINVDFLFDCVTNSVFSAGFHSSKITSPISKMLTVKLPTPNVIQTADVMQSYDFGYSQMTQLKDKQVLQCFYHHSTESKDVIKQLKENGMSVERSNCHIENFHPYFVDKPWQNNTLLIGNARAMLDPLANDFLDFVQHDITLWLKYFPTKSNANSLIDFYTKTSNEFYHNIFDYIIAHYYLSQWRTTDFWTFIIKQKQTQSSSLSHRFEFFHQTGVVVKSEIQYRNEKQWRTFLIGFNWLPQYYDPLVDGENKIELTNKIKVLRNQIAQFSDKLPSYNEYLKSEGL